MTRGVDEIMNRHVQIEAELARRSGAREERILRVLAVNAGLSAMRIDGPRGAVVRELARELMVQADLLAGAGRGS